MTNYIAKWGNFTVVWKNLTWEEYRSFKSKYEQSQFEEPMDIAMEIYSIVRIQGPDPKFVPAGIAGYVCKQQMLNNPFSGRYEDIMPALDLARRIVEGNYLISAKALIANTLNYKPEEIDKWDPTTFFIRLAQTEIARGNILDPVNPRVAKDSKNKSIPPKNKPLLSSIQLKALERTRERGKIG